MSLTTFLLLFTCVAASLHESSRHTACKNSELPSGCYCKSFNLPSMICTRLPGEIPSNISELVLRQSTKDLSIPDAFNGSSWITSLIVESRVEHLSTHAFAAFPKLERLSLSGVGLTDMSTTAFSGLPLLSVLHLERNHLPSGVFQSFLSLPHTMRELYIQENLIASIGPEEVHIMRKYLPRLRTFMFEENPLVCECEMVHLYKWLRTGGLSYNTGAPMCRISGRKFHFSDLDRVFFKCSQFHRPVVRNISYVSCDTIHVQWEYQPFLENISSDVSYRVKIVPQMNNFQSPLVLSTSSHEISVNKLFPTASYEVYISALIDGVPEQGAQSLPHSVSITQFRDGHIITDCAFAGSWLQRRPLNWDLTYRIIAVLLMVLVGLILTVFLVSMCSCMSRRGRSLTPTAFTPRPAYGHEPVAAAGPLAHRRSNAAALLSYAHIDPQASHSTSDSLRRQIMASDRIQPVKSQHVAYSSVLLQGKFGTMFQAEAFMVKKNQFQSKVSVVDFSQRRLVERNGGPKLAGLACLSHPNLFNVLGIVDSENSGPVTLVFDYVSEYLDLKSCLLQVSQGTRTLENPTQRNIFISEISAGMNYLSQKEFVHGDLSARNILITSNLHAKISLVGSSVDMYGADYFNAGNRSLPIRWMSPECIQYGTSSSHCDVWSMGVLIWEVFSNGQLPYCGVPHTSVAATVINKGCQLKQPKDCSREMWAIAKDCWILDPMNRINFQQIESRLMRDVWNISAETVSCDSSNHPQFSPNHAREVPGSSSVALCAEHAARAEDSENNNYSVVQIPGWCSKTDRSEPAYVSVVEHSASSSSNFSPHQRDPSRHLPCATTHNRTYESSADLNDITPQWV